MPPRESEHRREQARLTRRAILDAASALSVDPGYAATPLTAVLWLSMDVRNGDRLVRERGWPDERFRRWYVDTVSAGLFTPPDPHAVI